MTLKKLKTRVEVYQEGSQYSTNLKEFITSITKDIPPEFENTALIDIEENSGSVDITVYYHREETDDEYVARIALEKDANKRNKEFDLVQLKRLIAKYGIPEETT